jgi:hypothetical protein
MENSVIKARVIVAETLGFRNNIVYAKITAANTTIDCDKHSTGCIARLDTLVAKAIALLVLIVARHRMGGESLCFIVLSEQVERGFGCYSTHHDRIKNKTSYKTDNPLCHKSISLLRLLTEEDISLEEAACVLNISVDMANKYISIVKLIYGVDTLPAAVLQAAGEHVIHPTC